MWYVTQMEASRMNDYKNLGLRRMDLLIEMTREVSEDFLRGISAFNLGHVVCEMSIIHLSRYVNLTVGCTSLPKTQGAFF